MAKESPLHLLILGATGATGRLAVTEALRLGHHVTALARRPARLGVTHARLTTVACDVTADSHGLAVALRGQDAVLSILGRGLGLRSGRLIERSVAALLPAMAQYGPSRLVFVSAFGVGDSLAEAPMLLRLAFRTVLAGIYRDKAIGEEAIRRSALDWTIVRLAHLTDTPATGLYEVGDRLPLAGVRHISRADVAAFLVKCVADAAFSRRTVAVRS